MKKRDRTRLVVVLYVLVIVFCVTAIIVLSVKDIKAHKHEYSGLTVVAPTCTEEGYTLHTCSCGDSYKDEPADALGHDFEYLTDEYEHQSICSRCDFKSAKTKHAFENTVCADCEYDVHPTQGLVYKLNDGGASYSVTGIGTATDVADIVVFSTRNGLPVTKIEHGAFGSENIRSV